MSTINEPVQETLDGRPVGGFVQDAIGRWHASVAFDGHAHTTACRVDLRFRRGQVEDFVLNRVEVDGLFCPGCLEEIDEDAVPGEG